MKDVSEGDEKYQYGEHRSRLPIHTERLEIYFGINHLEANTSCYFSDMTLTMHQN